MQKQIAVIGVVLFSQRFIDFQDPATVVTLRVAFLAATGLLWLAWKQVLTSIAARNDVREVWVRKDAPLPSLLAALTGGGAAPAEAKPGDYKRVLVMALETEKASAASAAVLQAPLVNLGLSMALNIHLPLLIAIVQSLWGAFEDPLVQMHLLGKTLVRPHGELDEDPTAAEAAADAGAGAAPAAVEDAGAGAAHWQCCVQQLVPAAQQHWQLQVKLPGLLWLRLVVHLRPYLDLIRAPLLPGRPCLVWARLLFYIGSCEACSLW